jgi:hypothetical protein
MALICRRIADLDSVNTLLRGGVLGGIDFRPTATTSKSPVYGIHNKTLIFNTPAVTVTFTTPGASNQEGLTLAQILAAMNTTLTGNYVAYANQGRIGVVDRTGAAVVNLDMAGTANGLLGFNTPADLVGKVYNIPGGANPSLVSVTPESLHGISYIVITSE